MTVIQLGDTAKCTITGFAGTVISRHEYLNECIRLTLQPGWLKDGKTIEPETFDVQQLRLVKKGSRRAADKPPGGPHKAPKRPAIPAR